LRLDRGGGALRVELRLRFGHQLLDERSVRRVGRVAEISVEKVDGPLVVLQHLVALADVEQERRRRIALVRLAVEIERLVEVADFVFDARLGRQRLRVLERRARCGRRGDGHHGAYEGGPCCRQSSRARGRHVTGTDR